LDAFLLHLAPRKIVTLSLHDALPISPEDGFICCSAITTSSREIRRLRADLPALCWIPASAGSPRCSAACRCTKPSGWFARPPARSEEHTSELQSRENLVCRLLLEKKK